MSLALPAMLDRGTAAALVRGGDEALRTELAARPDLPLASQVVLARDPGVGVRHALAANPTTRASVRLALLDDPSAAVRAALLATMLEDDLEGAALEDERHHDALAASAHVSPRAQDELLHRGSRGALAALVANPSVDDGRARAALDEALARDRLPGQSSALEPVLHATALAVFRPLRDDHPASLARRSPARADELRRVADLRGVDPSVLAVLLPAWEGSVGALLTAASALGPDPS